MTVSLQYASPPASSPGPLPRLDGGLGLYQTHLLGEATMSPASWGLAAGAAVVVGALALGMARRKDKAGMDGLGDRMVRTTGGGKKCKTCGWRQSPSRLTPEPSSYKSVYESAKGSSSGSLPPEQSEDASLMTSSGGRKRDRVAKDQGDCLILGNYHDYHDFGRYKVCLTKTQKKKLRLGKKLGCGVFACAYAQEGSKDRVVKITRDAADVAALIEAQKTGTVPTLYSAYTLGKEPAGTSLRGNKAKTKAFAMVLERLKTFSDADARSRYSEVADGASMGVYTDLKEVMKVCKQPSAKRPWWASTALACDTAKTTAKLKAATGIKWLDAHAGNVGYSKSGKLKILDLGLTSTRLKEEPKILEGMNRAMARRLPGL